MNNNNTNNNNSDLDIEELDIEELDIEDVDEDDDEELYLSNPSIDLINSYNSGLRVLDSSSVNILDNSGTEILDNSGTEFLSLNPFFNRIMNSIDNSIESAVSRQVSFLEEPVYKTVITKEGEDKLKKIKFKDSEKKNISCPILFVDFDEEEQVIELECKHCFNEDAIKKWLKQEKAECPVCRYKLKDTKNEKIDKDKISRDDIRNNMRQDYVNYLSETVNTIFENETEIQIQRLLMQEYTNDA